VIRKRVVVNSALGLALLGTGLGGWLVVRDDPAAAGATRTVVTATRGTVSSTVSGTGNVTAPSTYALNFASPAGGNTVTAINVKVGDKVTAGQALATVDSTTLQTALQVAQAQLMSAQAALTKLQAGISPADAAQLTAQETQSANQVSAAKDAVTQAQNNFNNDTTTLDAAIDQAQANLDAAQAKQAADANVTDTQLSVTALSSGDQTNAAALTDEQAVSAAQTALTNAETNKTAKLAADTQAISAARRQVTAAQASSDATVAADDVKRAPASDADLATAQAQVATAQNGVDTAQKNLDAATLTAPVAGTITALTGTVGTVASSSASSNATSSATGSTGATSNSNSTSATAFITLIDFDSLEVKVGFTEADAAKVKAGQAVTVTFDSLANTRLTGTVRAIDITGTTVSNVVTYYGYVTLANPPGDGSVKPDMTATVSVVVDSAADVISVPTAAVSSRGTSGTVNVEVGNDPSKTTATQVQIGLRGDSSVEITNGLKEGDKIVIVVNRTGATTSATAAARTGATGIGTTGGGGGGGAGRGGFGGGPAGP
jgi:multidrug efflux pump subunit AcrA (membrane-fusion protein)